MRTKEEIIRAMQCILGGETVYVTECREKGCPYAGEDCMLSVIEDARSLLLNEEPECEPEICGSSAAQWYACGACGAPINPADRACRACGRKVKRND